MGELAKMRVAAQSHVGRARRENQDAHGDFVSRTGERLLVVADGMGGHMGGATASRMCVETLGEALTGADLPPHERLARGLVLANTRIREAAAQQAELTGMGTTAVALLFGASGRVWLGWVGDSRAYRWRGGALERLTEDHSVVAEWVRAGILGAEEAEQHPRRNELLRALGASDELEPEVREIEVSPGDRLLLCSDGLSAVVPLAEIGAVVGREPPEVAAKTLVDAANRHGGPDNVTVVLAEVTHAAASEGARPAPLVGMQRPGANPMAWAIAILVVLAALTAVFTCASQSLASDSSWRSESDSATGAPAAEFTRQSFYVEMRDGVPIAVDLYLPKGVTGGARVPAILRQTRYWRAPRLRTLWRPFADRPQELAQRFLARGYAWLDVDVRGSGASGGVQRSLWSDDEVEDGGAIVDWIVRQPWSNGAVGALGDSYDGTAAELLLASGRPAVRAVAPRFSLFDGYTDIAMPGGVRLVWFAETWGRFNDAIDRGHVWRAFPWWVPIFISGPRPVDGPDGAAAVRAAQLAHEANFDVSRAASQIDFRDDVSPEIGVSASQWSPCCARRTSIEKSGAAIYGVSGWWDGAYARAAVNRFAAVRNHGSRLLLGPWNHGGDQRPDPLEPTRASEFDHAAELLRFFDFHLKGERNGWDAEPPVHYFTTGEGVWKHAETWPPPATTTKYFLAANGALTRARPTESSAADEYAVDPESGTGTSSRWRGLAVPTWTEYGDRADADRHNLVYESAQLERDVEVTGHAALYLTLRADGLDAAVFAYLEDVDPAGRVGYVTEGQFRAVHRQLDPTAEAPAALNAIHSFRRVDARPLVAGESAELVFDLLPVSHRFRRGHRIRLALAGADRDQFAAPPGAAAHWWVERSARSPSRIELPVVGD